MRQPRIPITRRETRGFAPPTRGMWLDTGPEGAPPGTCRDLLNFLPGRTGRLPLRGPATARAALSAATDTIWTGAAAWNNNTLISGADSATVVTNFNALFGQYYTNLRTTMYHLSLQGGSVAINTIAAGVTLDNNPGTRYARLGLFTYIRGASSTTTKASTLFGGVTLPQVSLLKWDGTVTLPVAYVNAPRTFQDVKSFQNRLFIAGGAPADAPVAGPLEPNTLFFSDPVATGGAAFADLVTSWQDDTSGLINRIVVGDDDQNDVLVGLARLPQGLVVFKTTSTWVLFGSGPSNFTIKKVLNNIGCIARESIVELRGGVYFLSDRGYMQFDGTRVVNMSQGINSELLAVSNRRWPIEISAHNYAAALGSEHIMLTVANAVVGVLGNEFSYILHVPTQSWTRFAPATIAALAGSDGLPFQFVTAGPGAPILGFDKRNAWTLEMITNPEAAENTSPYTQSWGFDSQYPNSAHASFLARCRFHPASLSGMNASELHRIITDVTVHGMGAAGTNTFQVNLYSANNAPATTALVNYSIPTVYDNTPTSPQRHRHVIDQLNEVGDLSYEIVWPAGLTRVAATRFLYFNGAFVEFLTARPLPTGW